MSTLLPLLLVSGALHLQGGDAQGLVWEKSLAKGLERARVENRLLFVDFWRDQCIWCVRLESETFHDAAVTAILKDLVPVKAKNTEHLQDLPRYSVDSYPTLVLLDPEGQALDVHEGYLKADEFVLWIRTFRDLHQRMRDLRERIAKDPADLAARLTLGRLLANGGKRDEARKLFDAVLKADPEGRKAETAEAALELGLLLRRGYEYTKALDILGKARAMALALPAAGTPPSAADAGKAAAGKSAKAAAPDLLDRILYEVAATQVLAGKKELLKPALEEYAAKVTAPDAGRHAWVLLRLGRARLEAGDAAGAREAWKRCDSLYPRSAEARECREALAQAR